MDVVIVGAGSAGLTAAYQLHQAGWTSVRILEANPTWVGGRMRKDTTWDFPIDIGGEWIHGDPDAILKQIVDHELPDSVHTINHAVDLYAWDGDEFYLDSNLSGNYKWVNSTWWDFFNENVVSFLEPSDIVLDCQVTKIDYGSDASLSTVSCANGNTYQAHHVIVTASMKILQQGSIQFVPELPSSYQSALSNFRMEPGLKVFVEFQTKFYPDVFEVEQDWTRFSLDESSSNFGERLFYDETFGQTSDRNIMGLFVYGKAADMYLEAPNEANILEQILQELDSMFDGEASAQYIKHIVQVWPNEPYIMTGYTRWVDDDPGPIKVFQTPIDERLYFAGEALPLDRENWGFVHGAAASGRQVARRIAYGPSSGSPSVSGRIQHYKSGSALTSLLVELSVVFGLVAYLL